MSDKTKDGESAGTPEERGTAGQLFYPLSSGAIDHWLVVGPHATPLNALAASVGMELSEHPMLPQGRISSILRTAAGSSHLFLIRVQIQSGLPLRATHQCLPDKRQVCLMRWPK